MSKPLFEDILRFSGRRNRQSYLLYSLSIIVGLIAIWIIAGVAGTKGDRIMLVLAGLITLPLAVSLWAVTAQRCRDFGWTGWAALITLVPYVGWLFSLVVLCIPGTDGPNRYGPDPLMADSRF